METTRNSYIMQVRQKPRVLYPRVNTRPFLELKANAYTVFVPDDEYIYPGPRIQVKLEFT